MLDDARLQFSFSGLKTAIRYAISGPGKPMPEHLQLTDQQRADLAASFQAAVVDCLVGKAIKPLDKRKCRGFVWEAA